uniref:Addiction module protein n=1 Tax=Chlorobium chlorochromatii (strain CaD3) TaxID=340177 RepID=Q3ANT4_CHLCH
MNETIHHQILEQKPSEKINLVTIILESLDKPEPEIQKIWVDESQKRFDAFKAGKIKLYTY